MPPKPPSEIISEAPRIAPREYLDWYTNTNSDLKALQKSWQNDTFRQRGIGVIEEMLQDARVYQASSVMKSAVISLNYQLKIDVDLVKSKKKQEEIKDFVSFCLANVGSSQSETYTDILSSFDYGYSLNAIQLEAVKSGEWQGKWIAKKLVPLIPGLYRLEIDEQGTPLGAVPTWGGGFGSRVKGKKNDALVPMSRILYMRHGGRFAGPYGKSQLTRIYEAWWNKRIIRRMRNTTLDRFGSPFTIAKVPPNADNKVRRDMLKIITDMHIEGGAVINNTDQIEILNTGGAASGVQGFQQALDYEDREIVAGIVGSSLSLMDGGATGSYAQSKVHKDVMLYTIQMLSMNLAETLNEHLIYRLLEWNYGAEFRKAVTLEWNTPTEPQVDSFVKTFTQLAGFQVADTTSPLERAWIRDRVGWPAEEKNPNPVDPNTGTRVDPEVLEAQQKAQAEQLEQQQQMMAQQAEQAQPAPQAAPQEAQPAPSGAEAPAQPAEAPETPWYEAKGDYWWQQ